MLLFNSSETEVIIDNLFEILRHTELQDIPNLEFFDGTEIIGENKPVLKTAFRLISSPLSQAVANRFHKALNIEGTDAVCIEIEFTIKLSQIKYDPEKDLCDLIDNNQIDYSVDNLGSQLQVLTLPASKEAEKLDDWHRHSVEAKVLVKDVAKYLDSSLFDDISGSLVQEALKYHNYSQLYIIWQSNCHADVTQLMPIEAHRLAR